METLWVAKRIDLWQHLREPAKRTDEELSRLVGMSRPWVQRWRHRLKDASGEDITPFLSRSRCRKTSPRQVTEPVEAKILHLRDSLGEQHQRRIGARNILFHLHRDRDLQALGIFIPGSQSTVHEVLVRCERVPRRRPRVHVPRDPAEPMQVWEIDFTDVVTAHSPETDKRQQVTGSDTFNQYRSGDNPDNVVRRANLSRYLQTMAQRRPDSLLVLEAPGYRGSRLTGVPVTSRKVLLEGVPQLGLFGEAQGYQNVADSGFETVYGEQSATIVWGTLARLGKVPLIWNSFPLHPHQPGRPRSNRKPRKAETTLGSEFLHRMIALFQPQTLIAIGNVAHDTLTGMGFTCAKVRHPAQGGKYDFVAGMTRLLG